MTKTGGLARLSAPSRALLRRARKGANDDARALVALRDDLADLTDAEIAAVWRALSNKPATGDGAPTRSQVIYHAVDKARRKLVTTAQRFRPMLVDKVVERGGDPAPSTASGSLKALVEAFCDAERGDEIAAAAQALVRERSFAYDIT